MPIGMRWCFFAVTAITVLFLISSLIKTLRNDRLSRDDRAGEVIFHAIVLIANVAFFSVAMQYFRS